MKAHKPQTLNPKPQTPTLNPKPKTLALNPKPETNPHVPLLRGARKAASVPLSAEVPPNSSHDLKGFGVWEWGFGFGVGGSVGLASVLLLPTRMNSGLGFRP